VWDRHVWTSTSVQDVPPLLLPPAAELLPLGRNDRENRGISSYGASSSSSISRPCFQTGSCFAPDGVLGGDAAVDFDARDSVPASSLCTVVLSSSEATNWSAGGCSLSLTFRLNSETEEEGERSLSTSSPPVPPFLGGEERTRPVPLPPRREGESTRADGRRNFIVCVGLSLLLC